MSAPRKILLNPGPCTTTDRVKDALIMSDLCPREKEFGLLLARVRGKLPRCVNAASTHEAILLPGSGTAAMEACIGSAVAPDGILLIIDNGAYGRRARQIAQVLGVKHRCLSLPWTDVLRREQLEAALAEEPRPSACFMVHHETTTGLLNPLEEMVAACRARGVTTIVDAMSSFAGVPIDLGSAPADYVISSANKCIQGLPGLSFVVARKGALEVAASFPRRSVYLSLCDNWRGQSETGQFLFTPPVQILNALDAALDEFFEEGQEARYRRYSACYQTMLSGMKRLGFRCLIPELWHSRLLTAFHEPADPNWNFEAMHDALFSQGITVYPGKLSGANTFRIANIGALVPADLERFLLCMKTYLVERQISLPQL